MATNPDFKGLGFSCTPIIADWMVWRWYHLGMIVEGRTERLVLRPLELADSAQIQEVFPRWEIVRFLMNVVPWPYPPDGAEFYVREIALPQMERGEAWHWTIRPARAAETIIGSISLIRREVDNRGFWLSPEWHGQGLMSEACVWINDFWFETLGFEVLRVSEAVANTTSRRISEKQGMRLIGHGEKNYVSGRLPSEIFEITRDEWRAWKAHLY
jgi:RimJ/RimL family protein N-acetyltransferase